MNGAYAPGNQKLALKEDDGLGSSDTEDEEIAEYAEDALMDYAYSNGEFVAVIDEEEDHLEFWIARVKNVREGALRLRVRTLYGSFLTRSVLRVV